MFYAAGFNAYEELIDAVLGVADVDADFVAAVKDPLHAAQFPPPQPAHPDWNAAFSTLGIVTSTVVSAGLIANDWAGAGVLAALLNGGEHLLQLHPVPHLTSKFI